MNAITIRYSVSGKPQQLLRIDGDEHDIAEVLERCRRRIFPGVEPPVVDPAFDRAMVIVNRRTEGGDAHAEAHQQQPAQRSSPKHGVTGAAHPQHAGVRDTSRDALHRHQASGKLGKQEMLVYGFVRGHAGKDFTRQEIARALGLGINAVCGRVNALVNDHAMLRETRRRTCRVTGESVMAIGVVG